MTKTESKKTETESILEATEDGVAVPERTEIETLIIQMGRHLAYALEHPRPYMDIRETAVSLERIGRAAWLCRGWIDLHPETIRKWRTVAIRECEKTERTTDE